MLNRNSNSRELYATLQGWLFVSPHAVVFCLFTAFPVIFAFIVSLHKWNLVLPMKFTGIENYLTAFQDPEFWHSMKVTTIYVVGTVPTTIALALLVAVFLNREFIGRSYCRMMIYLPVITSTVSVGIIWMYLFEPTENGLVNKMFGLFGVSSQTWLANPVLAMPVLIALGIWKDLGFSTVILLAGLQGVPRMYYEAAEIDGASKVKQFWNITVPLVSPTTFFLFILNTISAFKVFGPVFVMTQSGPFDPVAGQNATNVIAYNIYSNAFKYLRMGYASSLACIFLVIILALTVINFRFGERRVHYQ
ncbi:sugar ABC transporter permease [bacterium]|nr:sugar ABC transporter permease [bacterium]